MPEQPAVKEAALRTLSTVKTIPGVKNENARALADVLDMADLPNLADPLVAGPSDS